MASLERSVAEALDERDLELRQSTTLYEEARTLLLLVVVILLLDGLYLAFGFRAPLDYWVADAMQLAVLLLCGLSLYRNWVPRRLASATYITALVANSLATTTQASVVGQGALAIITVMMAVASMTALAWRPFLVGVVLCSFITAVGRYIVGDPGWFAWLTGMLTAFSLGGMIMTVRCRSFRMLAQAQLTAEQLATTDVLTGLANRRGFFQGAELLAGQASRAGSQLFVVFLDITGLRRVNNEHGHVIGDLLLSRVADAMARTVRHGELACRWGGDESLIVGVGDRPETSAIVQRIIDAIDMDGLEGKWHPAFSVGVAEGRAELGFVDQIVELADDDLLERREAYTAQP